jgi:hypothetical protein
MSYRFCSDGYCLTLPAPSFLDVFYLNLNGENIRLSNSSYLLRISLMVHGIRSLLLWVVCLCDEF